jgi:hypothetical protein
MCALFLVQSKMISGFRMVGSRAITRNFNYVKAPLSAFSTMDSKLMDGVSGDMKTFSNYRVYKGKAAVSIKIIPPTFNSLSATSRSIAREGSIMFEFAPSAGGPREYDWTRKASFSLSVAECGELLAMDRNAGVEFFHDPNMGGERLDIRETFIIIIVVIIIVVL